MNPAFIETMIACKALRFGEWTLKSGRVSPYFFNAATFNDGISLQVLAANYYARIMESNLEFDMVFGPAYKGIVLSAALAFEAASHGRRIPFAYNRKEAKDHGEAGIVVGAPLAGRVLIIDDVITAGTAVREAIALIRAHNAQPVGLIVALDRNERGQGHQSTIQELYENEGIETLAVTSINDVIAHMQARETIDQKTIDALVAYQQKYGANQA